jgi:hypothetical protein
MIDSISGHGIVLAVLKEDWCTLFHFRISRVPDQHSMKGFRQTGLSHSSMPSGYPDPAWVFLLPFAVFFIVETF